MCCMGPMMFMDSIDTKKHLMLVYDDVKIGRMMEFHFIQKGLEKNEISIYLTHDPVKLIEKEMMEYGIDVNYFKKKSLLRVFQIKNPAEDSVGVLDSAEAILGEVLPNPQLPFRIVGRLVPDVGIETAISIQAYVEKIFHNSIFEKLNGSVLCTYDFSQIRANNEWMKWLHTLQENHHACIICQNGQSTITINASELN